MRWHPAGQPQGGIRASKGCTAQPRVIRVHEASRAMEADAEAMLAEAQAAAEAAEAMAPALAAAEAGDAVAMAAALDAAGAAVDAPGEDGDTVLHIGCLFGKQAVVEECLRRGASVTARDEDNSTPLHDASAGGHDAIVSILLQAGAELHTVDNDGDSPLHLASNGGHAHVVRLLLAHLARDETARLAALGATNALGQTPADLAEDPTLMASLRISGGEEDGVGSAFKKTRA